MNIKKIILYTLLVFYSNAYTQEFEKGKELFNANCAACHNMERKMTGPALKDIAGKMGREWLQKWIPNSKKLIESGDAEAVRVYAEYNQMAMPSYEYLKKEELSSIIDYLEGYNKNKTEAVAAAVQIAAPSVGTTPLQKESIPTYLIVILTLTGLVIIIIILALAKAFLIIGNSFETEKRINSQLMKKLGTSDQEVLKEMNQIVEDEVLQRVNKKIKVIKKKIDDDLKNLK